MYNQILYQVKNNDINLEINKNELIKNRLIPYKLEEDTLYFATDNYDFNVKSNLEARLSQDIKYEYFSVNQIDSLMSAYLDRDKKISIFKNDGNLDDSNLKVIEKLNQIIEESILLDVSDIHIEPMKDHIRIRKRKLGQLEISELLDLDLYSIILTRIKILAGLDISEKRLPQDGRFSFDYNNRSIDLRISTLPTIYGEKIAIRILDSHFKFQDIKKLGLDQKELALVVKNIEKLNGFILVCGPTNSGKSTTIYSILNHLNRESINITSLEDPVEYRIDGINQVQINYNTGLDFDKTLSSILRQDPDILNVGEIRTKETVTTALRAAITGHLIFSTLHTSDSVSAIYRLLDMGAETYMLTSALTLIISQRLIRVLCDNCKIEYLDKSGYFTEAKKLFKPNGCHKCSNGYIGRKAIFELLEINDDLRALISNKSSYQEIYEYLSKSGHLTLKDKFNQLLLSGQTSLEESIKI